MWTRADVEPATANDTINELQELIDEMLHLVDIWNMIESFRENGLNALPTTSQIKMSRLELLLATIFHNLNKRLPTTQHIDTDKSISLLLCFLIGAYDKQQTGRLTIFSMKIALATICAGKLVDKLRYAFSQISDANGLMDYDKFSDYLQQVLAIATAVFEGPTFGYTEAALNQCFAKDQRITLNIFLDTLMSDQCPACLMWLPLLHRMASVEHVIHPVICDACQTHYFSGFRYKCQRCSNYQLCQNCFWRGRTSSTHSSEHEMKEYSSYKSPTKQLAHSIQKSLRCVPTINRSSHSTFSERPQKPLDLANIIPMTPSSHHRNAEQFSDWSNQLLPGQFAVNGVALDDEHKLIARYSAKLSGRTQYPSNISKDRSIPIDDVNMSERAMIAKLEEENGEMMREMELIKQQQEIENADDQLSELRERKMQLEEKMHMMQQTRRRLMQQLETLMSQLNTKRAMTNGNVNAIPESLTGIGNRISLAFRDRGIHRTGSLPVTQLQDDLLHAAEDITNNMSTLLKELDQAHEPNGNIE